MTVDIAHDTIKMTLYNEIGERRYWNGKYEVSGSLTIDKSGAETVIESEGGLELLCRSCPMIHLTFDEMYPFASRPVVGLYNDDEDTLVPSKITVRGEDCPDSFPNYGALGREFVCCNDSFVFHTRRTSNPLILL